MDGECTPLFAPSLAARGRERRLEIGVNAQAAAFLPALSGPTGSWIAGGFGTAFGARDTERVVLTGHHTTPSPFPSLAQLVFEDDFNGNELNTSVWVVRNNFTHGNMEWQLYMGDEAWVADSNLVMRTRRNPTQGPPQGPSSRGFYNYTSAWVDSLGPASFRPTYGYIEWRAKLPDPGATGIWPALWLVTDGLDPQSSRCWPVGGEIDVMESVGHYARNSTFGTYQ